MRYSTLLWTVAALAVFAVPVCAHVTLDHAEPKVGSTVAASPRTIKIWFSDDVDMSGTRVEMFDSEGHRVDQGGLRQDLKDKSLVILAMAGQLPVGKYKVVWHALCLYKHRTKGEFSFEVGEGGRREGPG